MRLGEGVVVPGDLSATYGVTGRATRSRNPQRPWGWCLSRNGSRVERERPRFALSKGLY